MMTPVVSPFRCAALGMVESELVSSGKSLITGRYEKAPVSCPYNRWAALHGAPQLHCNCAWS